MLDPVTDSPERMNMNPSSHPRILALDAAGAACSAALLADTEIVARRWEQMARGHAEALMPMATEVVGEAGFDALDLLAVTVGPGAYTGLRIAIAAARGLGLAVDVPVLGVESFDLHRRMARDAGVTGLLAVVLETKRSDFYVQLFGADDQRLGDPLVETGPAVEANLSGVGSNLVLAGDAAARLLDGAPGLAGVADAVVPQHGDAAVAAMLAGERYGGADLSTLAPPRPLYLRAPDTTPPSADKQRLRQSP
ncbi:MAG: tRNA (adenosine(37)-N6)-threonylcarbamoyltransferase complex dimerization subunit type 1 TsaB [Alphaproteobacteria bacterium]|nr:tRNA (adenosine(37)-N6)-threonylcarbamoyltransferase complex dimerization subunit type 1 TsaB [Alphaproteobacteria bacterium]